MDQLNLEHSQKIR